MIWSSIWIYYVCQSLALGKKLLMKRDLSIRFYVNVSDTDYVRLYGVEITSICNFSSHYQIILLKAIYDLALYPADYFATKCGVLMMSLFVFFTTTMSVSFTLRETQTRMLKFTGLFGFILNYRFEPNKRKKEENLNCSQETLFCLGV